MHQTGLCTDVLESPDQDMEPYIDGGGLVLWLEENCVRYSFVIRYPEDKMVITGTEYRPWNLRYVCVTAPDYIMSHHLCLEEFLAIYAIMY